MLINMHRICRRRRCSGAARLPENPAIASSRLSSAAVAIRAPVVGRGIQFLYGIDGTSCVVSRAVVRVFRGESVDPGFGYLVELAADTEGGFIGCSNVIGEDRAVGDVDHCRRIGLENWHVVVCDTVVSKRFHDILECAMQSAIRILTWIRSILAVAFGCCITPCV